MSELTVDQVARSIGLGRATQTLPGVVARRLPALHPLDPANTVIAVGTEPDPTRYELLAGHGAVGTLLIADWPDATAATSHGVWRLTTQRRGVLSRIGVARDAVTGHAAAAYYPRLRPGGTIALHDTYFRLTLPWQRHGWWLLDEDDLPIATVEGTCTGKGCMSRSRTLRLKDAARDPHPDLALVLLTALWAISMTIELPVVSG